MAKTTANTTMAKINMQKAHMAKKVKYRDKELAKIDERIHELKDEVEHRIDTSVETEVKNRMAKLTDRKFLKEQFLGVFLKVGGAEGMVEWVKESAANRKEYYKMFSAMLKAETESANAAGQGGGGVTVNFFGLEEGSVAKTIEVKPTRDAKATKVETQPDNGLFVDFDEVVDGEPTEFSVDDLCK